MITNRFNLDIVDWEAIRSVAEMVESRTMSKGELKFGPLKVSIYDVTGQGTLRIDFKNDPNGG